MALPGSGQISLNDIATEYGGSAPHQLSEYHDKGNAPASGEIQIAADFYGTSNIFTYTIASNTTNVNLRTAATSAGWDGSAILQATINSGVTVYSTSTGSYAMTIDGGSFPTSSYLINNGTILGAGGGGGSAWSDQYGCGGGNTKTDGASGGPGLLISNPMTINNSSGRISGGGGGGGTGGTYGNWGTGGGGGGGCGNGPGGYSQRAGNGAAGSLTGGGSGGGGYNYNGNGCPPGTWTGPGGSGGGYAAGGAAGNPGSGWNPRPGGSGGAATSGNSNVTWSGNGTINGSQG
jgi:hypothetical protein